jgi:Glycogen recognition site of AMP-activated protein kinase
MIDDRRRHPDEDALDPQLERAVHVLRRSEPVTRAWRDQLLAQVPAHASAPARPRSGLVFWAPLAVAAGLCVAVGLARLKMTRDGAQVRFSLSAPSARQVSLVGDFDGWNPAAHPMRRDPAGDQWIVDVRLPPGRHVFAFSVDGGLRADPSAARAVEDDFGVPSSVIVVSQRGGE